MGGPQKWVASLRLPFKEKCPKQFNHKQEDSSTSQSKHATSHKLKSHLQAEASASYIQGAGDDEEAGSWVRNSLASWVLREPRCQSQILFLESGFPAPTWSPQRSAKGHHAAVESGCEAWARPVGLSPQLFWQHALAPMAKPFCACLPKTDVARLSVKGKGTGEPACQRLEVWDVWGCLVFVASVCFVLTLA